MAIEQDIQQLEDLVKHIEDYVNRGVWNLDRQKEILAAIDKANVVFGNIIDEYINMSDRPSMEQALIVSDLQERLHHVTHRLPSPPLGQEYIGMGTDKGVIIYTIPT